MATTTTAIARVGAQDTLVRPARSLWSNAWWKIRHDKLTIAAFVVLVLLALLSAGADWLAANFFQYTFEKQDLLHTYVKPTFDTPAYLLGTDEIGRSQVVRLLYAGRVSLAVGFVGAALSFSIGVVLGLAAGYFRGWVDDIFTWFVQTIQSIPTIFLLLIIASIWGPSPQMLVLILGFLFWIGISLYCRGQTFSLREREFIIAAKTIGSRDRRIMFRHILPNVLPLLFVLAAIDIGAIILAESALSFLGLGIQPPTTSWGNMLTGAVGNLVRGPFLVYPPGAMIFLTVLCLYLIGDGLRDALDPRVRGHGGL